MAGQENAGIIVSAWLTTTTTRTTTQRRSTAARRSTWSTDQTRRFVLPSLSAVVTNNNDKNNNHNDNNNNPENNHSSVVSNSLFVKHMEMACGSIQALNGKTIVVKYGGNAMTSPKLKQCFCQDIVTLQQLGIRIVVVHGGGPQINSLLTKLNISSEFSATTGVRISTPNVVDAAEMILSGTINKEIVATIGQYGGKAIGLSGRDNLLLQCTFQDQENLGWVGQVQTVNVDFLHDLLDLGLCPVISPIGTGVVDDDDPTTNKNDEDDNDDNDDDDHDHDVIQTFNVNADVAAGRIAGELLAARVLFLTDIAGVLDDNQKLIPHLSMNQVQTLIDQETITGGMIRTSLFENQSINPIYVEIEY